MTAKGIAWILLLLLCQFVFRSKRIKSYLTKAKLRFDGNSTTIRLKFQLIDKTIRNKQSFNKPEIQLNIDRYGELRWFTVIVKKRLRPARGTLQQQ